MNPNKQVQDKIIAFLGKDLWDKFERFVRKGYWISVVTCLVGVLIGGLGGKIFWSGKSSEGSEVYGQVGEHVDDISFEERDKEQEDNEHEGCLNYVEVVGEVQNPGVICLGKGDIVEKAIVKAGGFTEEACLKWVERNINKASVAQRNSKIFIPSQSDMECSLGGNGGEMKEHKGGVKTSQPDKISINNASAADLETISGVGPATAKKIIEGRPYNSLEDIKEVKGIGESTYENIKNYICL
jgi:competence protein ComEA